MVTHVADLSGMPARHFFHHVVVFASDYAASEALVKDSATT